MKLLLKRTPSHHSCTLGALSIDGVFECFTCEDQVREIPGVPVSQWKIAKQTAIPSGQYKLEIRMSPKFHRQLIHFLNVPGFDGILIHPGNTIADTDGCVLVGQTEGNDSVGNSRLALAALQPKVQAAITRGEPVTITISN